MAGPSGRRAAEPWEAAQAGPWGLPPEPRPLPAALADALRAVYRRADDALAAVAGTCRACGRCCRFGRDTPVLFASAAELGLLVAEAGRPGTERAPAPGQPDAPWQCPYQAQERCGARQARTLGCRTYFCQAEARRAGERVYAGAIDDVRRACRAARFPWWYGPARLYLAALRQ